MSYGSIVDANPHLRTRFRGSLVLAKQAVETCCRRDPSARAICRRSATISSEASSINARITRPAPLMIARLGC